MWVRLFAAAAALAVASIAAPGHGYAQGADIGKAEYMDRCASCHGEDGKGAGPVAKLLTVKVPDLAVLAKNNAGVFPFAKLYDVIDGREAVAAHGPRNMQVWGTFYEGEAERASGGYATSQEHDSYTRGKIIALIGYIYMLQAK